MNQRQGDAAQRAILEWVDVPVSAETAPEAEGTEKKAEEAKA